jgi:SPP1 gp7 family putative phage head morphogenesis protein
MATANELLFDRMTAHAIWLERYKARLVRELLDKLNAANDDTREQLERRINTILNNGGYESAAETEKRISELMRMLAGVRTDAYTAAVAVLDRELHKLATYEAEWQTKTLEDVIPIELKLSEPTQELLEAAVFEKPFNGAVLKDWADGMAPADLDRIERAVKAGVIDGQTTEQIVRTIMGTARADGADGLLEVSRRGLEAVARTAAAHVTERAREAVYSANDDIVSQERWTSVLDGRTTLICISRDGKLFEVGEGPRPPAHWRCRSIRVPVIDGIRLIGNRPTITDARTRRERDVDFRAEANALAGDRWADMTPAQRERAIAKRRQAWVDANIGGVPKETTYATWLKRQSADFQDEVLGPTRAKLFRDGGLTLDRFVDPTGHEYTLDQLRAMDARAFARAGL